MEQHHDIAVVLIDLFAFWSIGTALGSFLLDVSLQTGYLLVDVGNILLDYESEFL